MKEILVGCEGARYIDPAILKPLQGNLKDLSKENYEKLKTQILELKFSEPFSVWDFEEETFVLNGHQRLRVIHKMIEEGYKCPLLPCNPVEAKDMKEAKKKILGLTSQYGNMTDEGLFEFMHDSNLDFDEVLKNFRFPEIDMDSFKKSMFDLDLPEPDEGKDKPEKKKKLCPNCGEAV